MTDEEVLGLREAISLIPALTDEEIEYIWESIEKQTPKKPKQQICEYDGESWPACPTCSAELMPNGENYCSDCGQAIGWSEKEATT